jgi:hypothetical protein
MTIVRRIAVLGGLVLTVLGVGVPAAFAGESESIRTNGGIGKCSRPQRAEA